MEITKALLGAGCFWGIENYFKNISGIDNTKVGYSGGLLDNPSYEEVCSGTTGHAEVVLINFDKTIIQYSDILNHFWTCHDPTQLNRQGVDTGTQYRSIIFYYSEEQKIIAENSKKDFQNKLDSKIETTIEKAKIFFIAEDYHQCYIEKKNINF